MPGIWWEGRQHNIQEVVIYLGKKKQKAAQRRLDYTIMKIWMQELSYILD